MFSLLDSPPVVASVLALFGMTGSRYVNSSRRVFRHQNLCIKSSNETLDFDRGGPHFTYLKFASHCPMF